MTKPDAIRGIDLPIMSDHPSKISRYSPKVGFSASSDSQIGPGVEVAAITVRGDEQCAGRSWLPDCEGAGLANGRRSDDRLVVTGV
jgi:hypothetical protein